MHRQKSPKILWVTPAVVWGGDFLLVNCEQQSVPLATTPNCQPSHGSARWMDERHILELGIGDVPWSMANTAAFFAGKSHGDFRNDPRPQV